MKHFYTDPLAAAWMAKHFRMRFTAGDFAVVPGMEQMVQCPGGRLYIHPDSLHLLEPQVGDVFRHPFVENYHQVQGVGCQSWFKALPDATIIQRNGKAFHWPECEGA